jgi:hypothetical protein
MDGIELGRYPEVNKIPDVKPHPYRPPWLKSKVA